LAQWTVYRIRNVKNGKVYVGQTKFSPSRRFTKHVNAAREGSSDALHKAIRKHGADAFLMETISIESSLEVANSREIEEIAKHRSCDRNRGYNMTPGGYFSSAMKGKKHSAETIERFSRMRTGIKRPEHSTIMKLRYQEGRIGIGKLHGTEHPCFGKPIREETRNKLRLRPQRPITADELARRSQSLRASFKERPRRYMTTQEQQTAFDMRNGGYTISVIAERIGFSVGAVKDLLSGRTKVRV